MSVPHRAAAFGGLLREFRLAAGLTQEILAERAGLSPRTVQLLEAERVRPRSDTAVRLARALKLVGPDLEALEQAATPAPRRRRAPLDGDAPAGYHGPRSVATGMPAPPVDAGTRLAPVPLQRSTPTNVPSPVSGMIGRELDLAAIRDLLAVRRQRLVTLTGVGGAGKTRLAVQVAAELLSAFADGVWVVELAPTSRPELVPRLVAGVLGVGEVADVPMIDTLVRYFGRKHLLLVLDNCEHLIDACAPLAERLLTACPNLSILATSREPLRVSGERRWRVPPLTVPAREDVASIDALAGSASVRLFVERAQAIDADFRLAESNAAAVAQICARLDGIPLAIELAAARIAVLTAEQIAERLDDCFQLLAGGMRSGPTRQQTMQAALAWSYDLLTPSEQAAFRALSVFAGGLDFETAEAIVGDRSQVSERSGTDSHPHGSVADEPRPDALELLSRLVDKSLVVAEPGARALRYGLLEPVRQYAHRLLVSAGEEHLVRSRHASWYAALAERAAPLLRGPDQLVWLDRLETERDNLEAALEWIAAHDDAESALRLVVALTPFWEGRGYLSEARRWLEEALTWARRGLVSDGARLQALGAAGALAQWQGALEDAETFLVEALALARDLGDRRAEAELLGALSAVYRRQDASDRALILAEESLRLSTELDHSPGVAFALLNLGVALRHHGEVARSIPALEGSVRLYRELGDVRWGAIALTLLGWAFFEVGDHERAGPLLLEGVHELRAVGDQGFIVVGLKTLAGIACARGEPRRGAEWFAAAEALRVNLGVQLSPRDDAIKMSFLEAARGVLTASELREATAAGEALSLDQVLADVEQAWLTAPVRAGPSSFAATGPPGIST